MSHVAAFFSMKPVGHVHRTLPLVRRLAQSGVKVVAFVDARFRREVEEAGAEFFDLFGRFPIDGLDDGTMPRSARYVTYGAHYAEPIGKELDRIGARLVLYDTFAVVARAAAQARGLPYVNLCAGHAADAAAIEEDLRRGGFVKISPKCLDAVRRLKDDYGIADAHPFLYVSHESPFLNVYGEPPEFLGRRPEPAAFFGSIPDDWESRGKDPAVDPGFAADTKTRLRVCVSFGTMVYRFYPAEARAALEVIRDAAEGLPWVSALISLGGEVPALAGGRNVSVRPWIDPWRVLREADVLVTHHGLNSTHEAIVCKVPMLSYPFLWDQPAVARRCEELGLALPLAGTLRAPLTVPGVQRAFEAIAEERETLRGNVEKARRWEIDVMARRDEVTRRIVALLGPPGPPTN